MSRVRSILDRLNDLEATIARMEGPASEELSFAYELSLKSLENRRETLKAELADATSREFIEICDYRIVPSWAAEPAPTKRGQYKKRNSS